MNAMIKWYPYFFLIVSLIFILIFVKEQKKFHQWIFTYWGKKPTLFRKLQLLTYVLATILFIGALADWRGDEVTMEGKKSSEKTILLIDNSLSMLAEDVRPNRYDKAIIMARHFLKAAPGHEISVVLFSDIVRKYVPFTTDIDLLDARVSGLKELYKNIGGSSNIKQAIREALDYIDPNPLARKGNIVVFSDADGMDEEFPLEIGPNISVAMIAIGTVAGAPIPVRSRDGTLSGHKMHQGQQVQSKMNQTFLDSLGKQIKNYKYWVVTSYSLPTSEILDFLRNKGINGEDGNQNMRTREVLFAWWLVPAILFLLLSLIFKRFKTWTTIQLIPLLFVMLSNPQDLLAQSNKVKEIIPLLDALKENQLDDLGRLSAAQKLQESGDVKKALKIYQETLENKPVTNVNKYNWLNYAQALAADKKSTEAINKMRQVQDYQETSSKDKSFEQKYAETMLSLLQSEEKEKQEKQEKQKEKKENNEDKEDNKEDNKDKQDQNDQKDNEKENKNQEKDKNKDGEEKNQEAEKKDQQEQQQKSRSERQKELSSLLKQLLNEDRNLQQKLIETSTKDSKKKNDRSDGIKDW